MNIDFTPLFDSATKVEKKWGVEWWVVNNEKYCAKVLELFPEYQCSYHMHPEKDEAFTVLQGHVRLEIGDEVKYLEPGDTIRIQPQTFHRFSSMTGAMIWESSTTHDDADVVRKEESRKI